jgi:hypothetical protein
MEHVTVITNQLNCIFSGLHRARYQNAIEFQSKLDRANRKASDAETALKIAEQALADKQKELDLILALYQNSLA